MACGKEESGVWMETPSFWRLNFIERRSNFSCESSMAVAKVPFFFLAKYVLSEMERLVVCEIFNIVLVALSSLAIFFSRSVVLFIHVLRDGEHLPLHQLLDSSHELRGKFQYPWPGQ